MTRRPFAAAAVALALALAAVSVPAGAVGGDPGLPQQLGLRQIGAPTAWAGGAVVGEGVPIAVIDTGIDRGHEDLRDRIAAAVTCVGTDGDPGRCRADGADIHGHGSHVAGIAAASANGVGVSGVAPGARLVAVRVFTESKDSLGQAQYSATSADISAGIRWVLRNVSGRGPINLSLGGDFVITSTFGASFADAIQEAWSAGWLPVLASGNENILGLGSSNYGTLNALVVGATGPQDRVASYSSPTGDAKWALVAPGGDASDCEDEPGNCVLSTYKGGQYGYLQGTSMATPHVAGAAALLMGAGRSNEATVQRLLDTADGRVPCGGRCRGRLDVAKAAEGVAAAASGGGGAAPATTAAPGSDAGPGPGAAASPTTTARRSSGGTTAAPAPSAGEAAPPVSEPPTAVGDEVTTTAPSVSPSEVTGLSIDEAASAVDDPPGDDDGLPPLAVGVGGLAALAVTLGAGLAWRRRPS